MFNRKSAFTACGAAMLGLVLAASVKAASNAAWVHSNPNRTTLLTFSGPVALPGVVLPGGTYTFELPSAQTPDIVRVLSEDRLQVYWMAFTRSVARPEGLREDQMVTLGEASAGAPPPIAAWYPLDEATGHQFIYRNSGR